MGACCSSEMDPTDGMRRDVEEEREDESSSSLSCSRPRVSPATASMYSQQGLKGINQDSMIIWEDFAGEEFSTFCGVFDGHGPLGHKVSWLVRDSLPPKLQKTLVPPFPSPLSSPSKAEVGEHDAHAQADAGSSDPQVPEWFGSWQTCLENAFEEMDHDLGTHPTVDCICSGATAVIILRQKEHLIIANLGDSRAVLCTRDKKNHLLPVQLTVDQKPNVPSEAERITSCNGRVFSLDEEPDVHRVWLPDEDCPGLAMARAFGDFCLKEFGLISTPQISYRKLSDKDEFIVLATDGVWDVLSNKEVIKIVSSASKQTEAAKHLVKRAVRAWRSKCPNSKVDDCTAVCLFLKPPRQGSRSGGRPGSSLSSTESFASSESPAKQEDWTAIDSMVRWNTMTKKAVTRLQIAKRLSRRKPSLRAEESL